MQSTDRSDCRKFPWATILYRMGADMTTPDKATAARLADDPRRTSFYPPHRDGWIEDTLAFLRTLAAQPDDAAAGREALAEGREHLTVTGKFQSDKYPWCPAGFVPLKTTDPMARDLLRLYANRRKAIDEEFTRDLLEAT